MLVGSADVMGRSSTTWTRSVYSTDASNVSLACWNDLGITRNNLHPCCIGSGFHGLDNGAEIFYSQAFFNNESD